MESPRLGQPWQTLCGSPGGLSQATAFHSTVYLRTSEGEMLEASLKGSGLRRGWWGTPSVGRQNRPQVHFQQLPGH